MCCHFSFSYFIEAKYSEKLTDINKVIIWKLVLLKENYSTTHKKFFISHDLTKKRGAIFLKQLPKGHGELNKVMVLLFVFMLGIYTVMPYPSALSAGGEIKVDLVTKIGGTDSIITEEKINDLASPNDIEVILTLTDSSNRWADDIDTKKQLVLDSMVADIDHDEFKKLVDVNSVSRDMTDDNILIIKLKKDASYKISNNQTITMNLSPALLENWEGQVTPVSFTIYAKPRVSVGGSIVNASKEDLEKGGKEIELNLLNAKWKKEEIIKLSVLNQILDRFLKADNSKWEVTQHLKSVDPNKYVSIENDNKTLKLKLPPIPKNQISEDKIEFKPYDLGVNKLNNIFQIDSVNSFNIGNILYEGDPRDFTITSELSVSMTEKSIINPGGTPAKIDLSLPVGVQWNIGSDNAKKRALIDSLIAKNQEEQWEKVKSVLKNNLGNITVSEDKSTLTIVIPATSNFYLTADQTLSLKVPYQLLSKNVNLKEQIITIKATPKALVSGTVSPNVSQTDIVKGGKTIVVTLVNAKWADDIASNSVKRESLLSSFDWKSNETTSILIARADVVRTNDQVVTITLPPIDGFKVQSDLVVTYTPKANLTTDSNFDESSINAFTVQPVTNQSATLSGTILSKTNEFDMVKGGKTLIITLKNDVWVKDIETNTNKMKFTGVNIPSYSLKRNSDTVVTLTFDAIPGFSLSEDANVNLTIPAGLLNVSSKDINISSAFKIGAVKAEISGNGLALDPIDIQKGGRTITIKLKNATFKNDSATFINDLINGFQSNKGGTNWNLVQAAIKNNSKNVTVTSDSVTIKFPAVPAYKTESGEEISVNIPQSLINNASKSIVTDKKISIGQVAKATVNNGVFLETSIKTSENVFSITLEGTTWDPELTTNKTKRSALIKGFTTKDQTKEWSMVSSAIQSSGSLEISNGGKTLTIKIPAVASYSIIRDQVVDIKIPKTVLVNYKFDIPAQGQLTIKVPSITTNSTLGELLNGDFAEYINANGLENIRVIVPDKNVHTIKVNTTEFPVNEKSITTVEVSTNSKVNKVLLTIKGKAGEITREAVGSNTFKFVFTNLEKNSEIIVTVYGNGSSDPLQGRIYKKLTNGSKTYNELPKKNIAGSYPLKILLESKTLLKDIFKYYSVDELKVGK